MFEGSRWAKLIGAGCIGVLASCQSVDSSDINTDGIYASIEGSASGNGETEVTTSLRVGGKRSNTYLELVDGDALLARHGDSQSIMEKRSALGATWYSTTFPTDSADSAFVVSFIRTDHGEDGCTGESAPESILTLPEKFEISSPLDGASLSRSSPIELAWSNDGASDPLSWSASGSCIVPVINRPIEIDDGSFTIESDSMDSVEEQEAETCTVTLTVRRSRSGKLDSNYGEGGTVLGQQVRSLQVSLSP